MVVVILILGVISYGTGLARDRLSSSRGSGKRRVDVRAEQSLAEDGQDAALSLLAFGRADVDEAVDARGGGGSWECCQDECDFGRVGFVEG